MSYWLSIAQHFSVSLILATSCYLILRSGEISFGQQAFFGIGAYVGASATALAGWSLFAAILLAMLVAGLVAFVIGQSVCRSAGFRFTLLTLIFGEFVRELLAQLNWVKDVTGREVGPQGALGFSGIEYYFEHGVAVWGQTAIAAVAALTCLLAIAWLECGPSGRRSRAVAIDPGLASGLGINPIAVRLQAFVAAGAIAGLGGAVFAHQATYIEPLNFSLMSGVHAVAYTLLGGLAHLGGPVIGTFIDIALLEGLRVTGPYRMVAFGTLIVVVLVVFPNGVLGRTRRQAR
jgi:branched-chain amino acid transport system permease protein